MLNKSSFQLVSSPLLPSSICEACSSQFENVRTFKIYLLEKQRLLLSSIENLQGNDDKPEEIVAVVKQEHVAKYLIKESLLDNCPLNVEAPVEQNSPKKSLSRPEKKYKRKLDDYPE